MKTRTLARTIATGIACVLSFLARPATAQRPALPSPAAVPVRVVQVARMHRPAWAAPGMPDEIWQQVEAAAGEHDDEAMKARLIDAEARARELLDGHESDVDRRFALAVVLGMRADREGGRTKVRAASELHEELERILAMDPDHARARYLLGRLHAGVRRMNGVTRWLATNLLGGETLRQASWAGAEENLAFAERHAPEVPDHHLQLARLYLDTGRPDAARAEVAHVLSTPARSVLEIAARAEAAELARELADDGASDGR